MKPILIDIEVNGRFYTQIRYDKHGFPEMIDGNIIEVYDSDELCRYVEEKIPSLKGKNYKAAISSQQVFK